MATTEASKAWDATTWEGRDTILRVVKEQAEGFFALAEVPENWESPTASGHWQVRDIVGHLVDTTEGYLERFETTRAGGTAEGIAGLDQMSMKADERSSVHRDLPREELLARLHTAYDRAMKMFETLTEDEWGNLIIMHAYMGPVPAWFYPVGQLMDYGVHSWDVREGLGMEHFLSADVADLLVPFMFVVWQATCDPSRRGDGDLNIGIKVSGRNGGTFRFSCTDEGLAYEPGDVDDLPTVLEFDPASLVLTAFGRVHAGTAYGDVELARRFGGLFFRI
ncbi:MAG: maleylpyruvate isomerase family mycothiol-dependent enzyme [Actinobacteria bacterium]|nr:maleylpyruvate isomerase family mycothiol-dependent enzyme [Actinomycetota bacterium]